MKKIHSSIALMAALTMDKSINDCFMTDDRTGQYKPIPFSQLKPIRKGKRKKKGNYFTPKI